jgi:hypothetical protein
MKKFTILIAAIALVCFSVPAMAVDWNFYGNARMATFWTSTDTGDNLNASETDSKDQDLQWDLQGNSRIGATMKAENISGRFELGLKGNSGGDVDVGTRRIFGVWNFGAGKLKVGKDYSPTSQFISGQVFDGDLGLLGIGTSYSARRGQISLTFGNFEVALVTPSSGLLVGMKDSTTTAPGTPFVRGGTTFTPKVEATTFSFKGDPDEILPKLEVGWGMGFDTWNFNLMGGAQYFSIEDVTSKVTPGKTNDVSVVSWVLGGDVGFNFGPGYVKGAVSYGQNIGDAGWSIPSGVNGRDNTYQGGLAQWDGDDDTNDTDTFMGALVGGLKVSDMLSFEGGFGYRQDRTDNGTQRDTSPWAAYVQSVIALAPGVFVIPEIGYYDFDNSANGKDAGSLWYGGAKWQINF